MGFLGKNVKLLCKMHYIFCLKIELKQFKENKTDIKYFLKELCTLVPVPNFKLKTEGKIDLFTVKYLILLVELCIFYVNLFKTLCKFIFKLLKERFKIKIFLLSK